MSLQVFYASPTLIDYPQIDFGTGPLDTVQLRHLYFSVPAQLLIGEFWYGLTTDVFGPPIGGPYHVLCRLWRDGTRLTWAGDGALAKMMGGAPRTIATDVGTIGYAPAVTGGIAGPQTKVLANSAGSAMYYRVNDVWPMDLHTGEVLASAALLSSTYLGLLRPSRGIAYRLENPGGGYTQVTEVPTGTVRFSSVGTNTYRGPRELLFIDSRTVALTFRDPAGLGAPSILRVFDITTSAWTLRWEDTLPGSAHVAAWDPIQKILYATSRYPSNATLYACRLKRAPTTVAVPTLVGASALHELTATRISTLITDGRGSVISMYPVRWTLSASLSGGALDSAYSLTNASGVATITYVGPRLPPAGLTEAVTAAVSDVEG